jgi:hypothetical protein
MVQVASEVFVDRYVHIEAKRLQMAEAFCEKVRGAVNMYRAVQ